MTLFFPDVNVWVALSAGRHVHSIEAWKWLDMLSTDTRIIFSRFTQLGLLRLLTNTAVMGELTHTLGKAWAVYDRWLDDPRIQFHSEPDGMDSTFRDATVPFHARTATNWVSDCYVLAYAKQSAAVLVTFDKALLRLARESGCSALTPV